MFTYFRTETEDISIGKSLSEKKYGGTGLVSEKTEALYTELNERVEAATSSYSATVEFLHYIYSVLVAKNHQKIPIKVLSSQIYFLIPFYMFVASSWYYEKCTERCALQLYRTSLSIFVSFSAAELNNIEREGRSFSLGIFMRRE